MSPGTTALAIASLVGPLLLGWVAGRGLDARGRAFAVALLLSIAAVCPLGAPAAVWDAVALCLSGVVGLGLASLEAREAARVLAAFLCFGVVAEGAGRAVLPPPPAPHERGWALHGGVWAVASANQCAALFPASSWSDDAPPPAPDGSLPVTLHVGDSMLQWVTPEDAPRAVELLDRDDPTRHHIWRAHSGLGPDAYAMMARAAVHTASVDHVVVHLFPENDLADLDRVYPCCRSGPLLDPAGEPRCRTPTPPQTYPGVSVGDAARTPMPLWFQTASAWSRVVLVLRHRLAGWLRSGSSWWVFEVGNDLGLSATARAARHDRIVTVLTALASDLSPTRLTVAVLPYGPALPTWRRGESPVHRQIANAHLTHLREAGLTAVDLWPAFADATDTDFFEDGHHLTASGHARLARALTKAELATSAAPDAPPAPPAAPASPARDPSPAGSTEAPTHGPR